MRVVRQVSFQTEQWERIQKHAESRGMPVARFMRFAVMQAVSSEHDKRRVGDLLSDLESAPAKPFKAAAAPRPARAPARAARRVPGP